MPRLSRQHTSLLATPLLAAAAACASSSAGAPPPTETAIQTPVRVGGGGFGNAELRTNNNVVTETATIAASPDRAYQALVNAYGLLTLTPNQLNSTTREVGVVDARVRRRLGRDNLSRFLNCGDNVNTGPNADSYDVVMTVQSRLSPVPGDTARSTLATVVTASARPVTTSGNTVTCASTGRLEERIVANTRNGVVR